MWRDSRVELQLSTNAVVNKTSFARFHASFSFRKWRPPDRDNNREATGPISSRSSRNPVNTGVLRGCWTAVE